MLIANPVQVPQLIENYWNGNAEAISLLFLFVWFIGDITNLIGGAWAGLVPVIVAIAVYFCIADGVLIAQCLYYNPHCSSRESASSSALLHRHPRPDHPFARPSIQRYPRTGSGFATPIYDVAA
jgi:hypothetical protein